MKKKGQFYLVSAIVLVTVILGVIAVSNYSRQNSNKAIYELKDEIEIESKKVLDYSLNNSLTQLQTDEKMISFTQNYINSDSKNKDLYFIFGTLANITVKGYQNTAQVVKMNGNTIYSSSGTFMGSIDPADGTPLTLSIGQNSYDFALTKGQNFYFLIIQESGGNQYVLEG